MKTSEKSVRVRFAPSPTGPLHIGGVRTALFNYLFARKHNGRFILRIEDTDRNRYVKGAEQYILESLNWCGIEFDEGVHVGGPFGPYRQSERKEIYGEYAINLIDRGLAYYAFDTQEELEEMRKRLESEKKANTSYSYLTRDEMKNSLTLPPGEVEEWVRSGKPYVIRFMIPEERIIRFSDIVRGDISVHTSALDDKILFKSDGMPTYHLANVVDDHLMKITHVIRGEEWLPSLALHVLLYRAFGWEGEMPEFAHMPLTLKPDGRGKLSKRDGDRLGFPVFPLEWKNPETGEVSAGYRESGYFPEAFINILALLGWNPGTEKEVFTMNELIDAFSLERIIKSGSRFDPGKARWFNHQYLMRRPVTDLAVRFLDVLAEKNLKPDLHYVEQVVALIRERADFVRDFWEQGWFFFVPPETYDEKMVKKRWKEDTPVMLQKLKALLDQTAGFTKENLESRIRAFIDEEELGAGQVMSTLRLCLVGSGTGPGVYEIMELLGKEETVRRIETATDTIER